MPCVFLNVLKEVLNRISYHKQIFFCNENNLYSQYVFLISCPGLPEVIHIHNETIMLHIIDQYICMSYYKLKHAL